jgi:hypothetical protein
VAANVIELHVSGGIALALVPPPRGFVRVTARYGPFVVTSEGDHVMYTLPVGKEIAVQVSYVDQGGNTATVDGEVAWASSDPTIAAVTVNPSDTTQAAVAASGGTIGSAQITATADADLGTGVRELLTLLDLTVVAGEAVAGVISITGDPTPIAKA